MLLSAAWGEDRWSADNHPVLRRDRSLPSAACGEVHISMLKLLGGIPTQELLNNEKKNTILVKN